jgi:hypothetical protein
VYFRLENRGRPRLGMGLGLEEAMRRLELSSYLLQLGIERQWVVRAVRPLPSLSFSNLGQRCYGLIAFCTENRVDRSQQHEAAKPRETISLDCEAKSPFTKRKQHFMFKLYSGPNKRYKTYYSGMLISISNLLH